MKQSEIKAGKMYVGKRGVCKRVVVVFNPEQGTSLRQTMKGQRCVLTDSYSDGKGTWAPNYHTLQSFASWAKAEVKGEGV